MAARVWGSLAPPAGSNPGHVDESALALGISRCIVSTSPSLTWRDNVEGELVELRPPREVCQLVSGQDDLVPDL